MYCELVAVEPLMLELSLEVLKANSTMTRTRIRVRVTTTVHAWRVADRCRSAWRPVSSVGLVVEVEVSLTSLTLRVIDGEGPGAGGTCPTPSRYWSTCNSWMASWSSARAT